MPLRAGRAGRVLRGGRCPCGDPHDEAAQAKLDKEDQAASMKEAEKLAPKYCTEL